MFGFFIVLALMASTIAPTIRAAVARSPVGVLRPLGMSKGNSSIISAWETNNERPSDTDNPYMHMCDRDDQKICVTTPPDTEIVRFTAFADKKCEQAIKHMFLRTAEDRMSFCPKVAACFGNEQSEFVLPRTFWIQPFEFRSEAELFITEGTDCGHDLGIIARVGANSQCIPVQALSTNFGMKLYPCGRGDGWLDGTLDRRTTTQDKTSQEERPRTTEDLSKHLLDDRLPSERSLKTEKKLPSQTLDSRDTVECKKFTREPDQSKWNFNAFTKSIRVSHSQSCPLSSTTSCELSISEGQSVSFSTSFTTAVGVNSPFASLEQSFTSEYGESSETTQTYNLPLTPGGRAFASARMQAVVIPGIFEDCDNGWWYRGEVTIPKKGTMEFAAVYH